MKNQQISKSEIKSQLASCRVHFALPEMKHAMGSAGPTATAARQARKPSGQGLAEFSLVLPVLLVLVFGVIEFGRLLFYFSAITTGAREAARYAAAAGASPSGVPYYQDCDGIRGAAIRIAQFAGIQNDSADVLIAYDHGPSGGTISGGCPVGGTGPTLALGDRILVTVTGEFTPLIPFINFSEITIPAVAKRTLLVNVSIQ